jgi:hypothetical protein
MPPGKGSRLDHPARLPAPSSARLIAKARLKSFIGAFRLAHGHGPSIDSIADALNTSHYQAKRLTRWLIENGHATRGADGLIARDTNFADLSILLPQVAPPKVQPKYRHAVTCVRTGAGARRARMETR